MHSYMDMHMHAIVPSLLYTIKWPGKIVTIYIYNDGKTYVHVSCTEAMTHTGQTTIYRQVNCIHRYSKALLQNH